MRESVPWFLGAITAGRQGIPPGFLETGPRLYSRFWRLLRREQ